MKPQPIIVEKLFTVPVEKVWSALTSREEMKQWYFNIKEFRAEVGFQFQFTAGPNKESQYLHVCEVTEVIPNKRLAYSWRYDGYAGISFVTFELIKQEKGTLLRLTHQGIESFPNENPDFAIHNFEKGWDGIVGNSLKNYLQGQVL